LAYLEMTAVRPNYSFWQGKRVLLTGHTGFKGAWLTLWLSQLGAEVTGISLPPNTNPSLFELAGIKASCHSHYCDIRDAQSIATLSAKARPEIVFHLAAQPLVRASYQQPLETFSTNIMGSANLLEALRGCDKTRVAVMITTDKVYRNNEWPWPYRENDTLGGHDPYSASKAAAEIVIESYHKAFLAEQGLAVASARAGNVIGGGDWSADRLIPDAVRAWQANATLNIRRPQAVRPWQHVLEPLAGYLVLAQRLWENADFAGAYNFGPPPQSAVTVREIIELARTADTKAKVRYHDEDQGPHEAHWLTLETAKTRHNLGYQPILTLPDSIQQTMTWYRAQHGGEDARKLCEHQINAYESAL
jgi:CDP-glucose 4,6-dehydratase